MCNLWYNYTQLGAEQFFGSLYSPPWSRNSLSWNPKVHRPIQVLHPSDALEQVDRGLTLASCFNIILSFTPRCFSWFLPFGFWNKCYFLRRGIPGVPVECVMKKYNRSTRNFTVPTVMTATVVVHWPGVFLSLNFVLFSSPHMRNVFVPWGRKRCLLLCFVTLSLTRLSFLASLVSTSFIPPVLLYVGRLSLGQAWCRFDG